MSMHRGFTVAGKIARHALVACATTSLIASTALTPFSTAFAQAAPQVQAATPQAQSGNTAQPYPGPPITAQTSAGDPPARVGRIARMNGTVSFHTADEDQWGPATLNYPLTAGNALWTEPGARADLQIGSANRLVMDSGTELNVANLDDSRFEANLPQGSAYLSLNDVASGDSYAIQTPRGTVQISEPGRYLIAAGDDKLPTTVTALDGGKAQLSGRSLNQAVPAGQTATLTGPLDGDDPVQAALGPQQPSSFVQSVLAEEKSAPVPQAAAPATPYPNIAQNALPQRAAPAVAAAPAAMPMQVQGMTGAQDLAAYGAWSSAPDYGSVWYPPVEAGWVPYRHGHWAFVHPWGWTWVADEPWGFAPFHYGRWVRVHDRWAWSPGMGREMHYHHHRPRPVYAPALVAFFGSAGGLSVSITTGGFGGNVGWVPLGWHEPYYPPYRVSRTYIRNVNVTHVTNITRVTNVTNVNNVTVNRYVNRNSATVVSADAMRRSQPVERSLQTVDRRQIDNARVDRRAQIQPTAATAGMSPQAAQRMGIQNDGRNSHRDAAPGPQIRQADLRQTDVRQNDSRRDSRAVTNTPAPQARIQGQQTRGQEAQQPQRQERRDAATAPAPRQMTREQAAQPQNARPFDGQQQRETQQRGRAEERPQAQPRQQVQTEALPQQQAVQRQQAQQQDRQRQDAQRQEQQRQAQQQSQRQDAQRQEQHQQMQRQQQAEQQNRQRQDVQQRQAQQQNQQQAQRQQETQRQQESQRQQAQQQQRDAQQQQQAAQQQHQRQQEVRRQQDAQADAQRQQQRREQ